MGKIQKLPLWSNNRFVSIERDTTYLDTSPFKRNTVLIISERHFGLLPFLMKGKLIIQYGLKEFSVS
jgi:hypothetical protein